MSCSPRRTVTSANRIEMTQDYVQSSFFFQIASVLNVKTGSRISIDLASLEGENETLDEAGFCGIKGSGELNCRKRFGSNLGGELASGTARAFQTPSTPCSQQSRSKTLTAR